MKDHLLRDYLGFVENSKCYRGIEKCVTIQNILKRLEKLEGAKPKDDDFQIKLNFLAGRGFKYNHTRDMAANKKSQIAMTFEYIQKHPIEKLKYVISKRYKRKPKYFFVDTELLASTDVTKILDRELFNKKSRGKQ